MTDSDQISRNSACRTVMAQTRGAQTVAKAQPYSFRVASDMRLT